MSVIEGRHTPSGSPPQTLDAEVVVIGTGAGGGPIAAELAEAGVDVVLLEEGGYYRTDQFTTRAADMVKILYRNAGATMAMGNPNVMFAEGRCVGGSTVVNAGICWRTPDRILKRWAWEYGIPEVDPATMRPIFERVEQRVNVSPQDELTYGGDAWVMKEGATALGYRWMPVRRNQKHCVGTNSCVLGCPTGAKQSVLVTYVPRALAAGARLFSDCRVVRILHEDGRGTGVEAELLSTEGKKLGELRIRAGTIVVAGGAVQTPVILKRSRVPDPHRQIGKNLTVHPNAKVVGIFDRPIEGWKGAIQGVQITEFMEEGILFGTTFVPPSLMAMTMPYYGAEIAAMMKHLNHMVSAGVLVEDTDSVGAVDKGLGGEAHVTYTLGPLDFHRLQRGVALLCEIYFAAGATKALLPYYNLTEISGPGEMPRLFDPSLRATDMEVLTMHVMGTARMAADPRRGPVDAWGRLHALPNVLVSDASLLPTPVGVNPQITIMALSTRNAQHWLASRRAA